MKNRLENILHIIIVITTIIAIAAYFFGGSDTGTAGTLCFRFFTTDSNVVACVASLICLIYAKNANRPHWATVLQFVGTAAVTVTFVTVVIFLAPVAMITTGNAAIFFAYFKDSGFVLHFSTPVLSIIAMLIAKTGDKPSKRESLWGMLPVAIYSIVYVFTVIIYGIWPDFYGFTFGGHIEIAPVSLIVMYLLTFAITRIEWRARCRVLK